MQIYLSTGAFTGRKNGRDHTLAIQYAEQLECDGFELLFFEDWYERLPTILADYRAADLRIPVVHLDKDIGSLMCAPGDDEWQEALRRMRINCKTARKLSAWKVVLHIWGMPHSDSHAALVYNRVAVMMAIGEEYDLDVLIENIPASNQNGLAHLEHLAARYPEIGFTVDTRCAQFTHELPETCASGIWQGNVRHVHINDVQAAYKDWTTMYPILQPGRGDVDFDMFFAHLRQAGYDDSITLEAPSIQEQGVDVETLNAGLQFIRQRIT